MRAAARRCFGIPIAITACVLMLGACAGVDQMLGGGLGGDSADAGGPLNPKLREISANPPTFSPGDRYAFSNPDVIWEVVAVEGGEVVWRADNGDMQRTGANPLLPALEWSGGATGRGKRLITDMTEDFFPLRVGKEIRFRSTVSSDKPPYAWEFDWQCAIEARERLAARIGEVDVYKITCGRQRPDEITFYYAPEVGHYVRLVAAKQDGSSDQRWLTGFQWAAAPPALRGLEDTMVASADGSTDAEISTGPEGSTAPAPASVEAENVSGGDAMASMTNPDTNFDTAQQAGADTMVASTLSQDGSALMSETAVSGTNTSEYTGSIAAAPAGQTASGSLSNAAGGLGVHIASYRDPNNAETGWKSAMSANPTLLDGTRPVIRRVDLGDKGIFYRLHAGPITDRGRAETLCKALKAAGRYCTVRPL